MEGFFELWTGEVIEHIDLSVLFFGNLEDEHVERDAFGGGLGCEVSDRSKDYQICSYDILI